MEEIALEKKKQKKLTKRAGLLKEKIKSGAITINEKRKRQRKPKAAKNLKRSRGAIYISRLPHGFYEDELKSYFKQFGMVTRVKVARSSRTGKSKGYGFVEFLQPEVAKIAAETMDNYLIFNSILKCKYIPPEEQRPGMFIRTIFETNYPRSRNRSTTVANKNKLRTKEEEELSRLKAEKKIEELKRFYQDQGIQFDVKVNDPRLSATSKRTTKKMSRR